MAERIALSVNERHLDVTAGSSVAAAVMQTQNGVTRRSVSGEPRGPLCGMGVCFECRVTIDGAAQQRSCQELCKTGMRIESNVRSSAADTRDPSSGLRSASEREFDIVVVGAGPAGISAACSAAQAGQRVGIIDDNSRPGGQIWRHDPSKSPLPDVAKWLHRLQATNVEVIAAAHVYAVGAAKSLLSDTPSGPQAIRASKIILACGARERFLPFPGWTLPGVFGAGGLQALVKSGYPITGKRVIVAGSGPLLLAVAAFLTKHGADVRIVAEQTPRAKLLRFGASLLWRQPTKVGEALGLKWALRGIPYRAGCWPLRAEGNEHVASVTLTDGVKTWSEPCDALACGFGLVPNLELALLMGCAVESGFVQVNDDLESSAHGIYAIGELTGIGGLDKAILEGHIAGASAAGRLDEASKIRSQRQKAMRFVSILADAFWLRDELRRLMDGTIVCRCEDVTYGGLRKHSSWRDAKLQTRCGMGPCQGRICGPAVEFLFGWPNDSVRPPIFPTGLANLAVIDS